MQPKKPTRAKTQAAIADTWKAFYGSPEGRAAIADLMVWCNVYTPIEESDPIVIARATGERNVALRIAQLIGLQPAAFPSNAWEDADILDRMLAGGRQ